MSSAAQLILHHLFWCSLIQLSLLTKLSGAETITVTTNGETIEESPQPAAAEHVEEVITPIVTDPGRMRLVQIDPVEVGHIRRIEIEPGHFYEMKTVAVNPPVFLVPDFLTLEECERIKSLAQEKGLEKSRTVLRHSVDQAVDTNLDPYFNKDTFTKFDEDGNQFLNIAEARKALTYVEGIGNMSDQAFTYFIDIVVDLDSDRFLSDLEFRRIPLIMTKISEWIANHQDLEKWDPDDLARMKKGPDRLSHQVWMKRPVYDESKNITNRLIGLTGLHPDIINTSEELQVVHYTPGGHYHAHHDSTNFIADRPCSHTAHLYPPDPTRHLHSARICRYMTVLYYLADTEEGGETAFPAADNETFSESTMVKDNKTIEPSNLSMHCKDANLYVRPKKRMAVMWYNHFFDHNTGWMGDRNLFAFHGGCDVIKGEKWIANNWINVDNNYEIQMKFHYESLHKTDEPVINADITPKAAETTEDQKSPPDQTEQEQLHNAEGESIKSEENVVQLKQEL